MKTDPSGCKSSVPYHFIIFLLFSSILFGCSNLNRPGIKSPYDEAVIWIEGNYMDSSGMPVKLNTSKKPDFNDLLLQLEPGSVDHLTKKEKEILDNPELVSPGIIFREPTRLYPVIYYIPEGASARGSGLLPGDSVIEIDGRSTKGLSELKTFIMLKGPPGSKVSIKALTPSNIEKSVKIVREKIDPVPSLCTTYFEEKRIGYLRIARFGNKTYERLGSEIPALIKNGMTGLIIDLRDNDGGPLDEVMESTGLFLRPGAEIATVLRLDESNSETFRAGGKRYYIGFSMAVLVDSNTASGAEIMAAALKSHKRAALIGEKTYGNAQIKAFIPLSDGSMLSMRTGYIYGPDKMRVEGNGVEPDIEVKVPEERYPGIYDDLWRYCKRTVQPKDELIDLAVGYLLANPP